MEFIGQTDDSDDESSLLSRMDEAQFKRFCDEEVPKLLAGLTVNGKK
jgi:hypothetical protein